jgi:hypothetical protein
MTSHGRRAARLRQRKLEQAIDVLKANPKFPAAQVQAHDRAAERVKNLSPEESRFGTPERMNLALEILKIQAEAYLDLVKDMKSQEALMTFLEESGRKAFENFAGVPLEAVVSVRGDELQVIQQRVSYWVNEGYKRLIPSPSGTIEQTAPRRGYRAEVKEWMAAREIETVAKAAKALAVSETTLKSIMSDKGDVRYSRGTLEQILKKIRP